MHTHKRGLWPLYGSPCAPISSLSRETQERLWKQSAEGGSGPANSPRMDFKIKHRSEEEGRKERRKGREEERRNKDGEKWEKEEGRKEDGR